MQPHGERHIPRIELELVFDLVGFYRMLASVAEAAIAPARVNALEFALREHLAVQGALDALIYMIHSAGSSKSASPGGDTFDDTLLTFSRKAQGACNDRNTFGEARPGWRAAIMRAWTSSKLLIREPRH
jgi:hypothetical protein